MIGTIGGINLPASSSCVYVTDPHVFPYIADRTESPPPSPAPTMNAAADHDSSLDAPRVRLMCSLGGRILPRPQDNQLRYVGGDTRIVAVHRSVTFSTLHDKLSKLSPLTEVTIKYQLPNEDLDALISVTGDEDVENMMEEHDRLVSSPGVAARTARLRLFIFPAGDDDAVPAGFGSMLDGSGSKRDSWFLDVLNGGTGRGLERGRSDASSLLSEVPDYLFGLDNNSEDSRPKLNASEPNSPLPAVNSPKYSSTSSLVAPSVGTGYAPEVWHDVQEPVQVYYMPPPFRSVPVQYFNPVQPAAGGPMYRPPPVQGVWSNPGHSVPVYSPAYSYPVGGDGGRMLKGPVYPAASPAGGEMAGAATMGRGSQN